MITDECLDRVCSEVDAYSDDRMTREFDDFFKEQPHVCAFVAELTSESTAQIQELCLFLSYLLFKTVKSASAAGSPLVSEQAIEEAFRESEGWIDRISQGDMSGIPPDAEPYLVRFVIGELNQPLDDESLLDDEQKGEVFFVLKTVISSLTRSPLGKEN